MTSEATPYELGHAKGHTDRTRLSDAHKPIIPAYLDAQAEVTDLRYLPVMSAALTQAHRRARSFALGYLRGFREES